VSLVATDQPITQAVLDLARQAGVSVIAPQTEQTISAEFDNIDGEAAFRFIASAAGLGVLYRDGVVSFGDEVDGRESFAILDPGYVEPNRAAEVFGIALGSEGEVREVGGRLAFGGSREGLRRAVGVAKGFRLGPDGWLLRVLVFEVSEQYEREIGVDLDLGFNIEAQAGGGAGNAFPTPLSGVRAAATVTALGKLAESGTHARIRTVGTLFLLEGQESTLQQGDSVPIPQRTVSPEGTVRTENYQYVDTGFEISAIGRRVPGGMLLELTPKISSIAGFIEEAPIFTQSTVTGTVVVQSGEWVMMSGLQRTRKSDSVSGLPGVRESPLTNLSRDDMSDTSLIICVHAERVTQGTDQNAEEPPAYEPQPMVDHHPPEL